MMIDDQHIDRPSADEANAEMADGFRKPTKDEARAIREMFASYAPTTELPEEPRTGVKGTVVDGDVL